MLVEFLFEEDEQLIDPIEFLGSFSEEEFNDGTVYHALSTIYNFTPLQIKDVVSHYLEHRDQ